MDADREITIQEPHLRDSSMTSSRPKFPWLYLVLAYGLAWALWIPVAMTGQDYQESPLLLFAVLLGVFGPGIGEPSTSGESVEHGLRSSCCSGPCCTFSPSL
jgi:hypothetical protein